MKWYNYTGHRFKSDHWPTASVKPNQNHHYEKHHHHHSHSHPHSHYPDERNHRSVVNNSTMSSIGTNGKNGWSCSLLFNSRSNKCYSSHHPGSSTIGLMLIIIAIINYYSILALIFLSPTLADARRSGMCPMLSIHLVRFPILLFIPIASSLEILLFPSIY